MSQFLFVVDISYPQQGAVGTNVSSEWNSFEIDTKNKLPPSLQSKQISRNVWLFDSENTLPDLLSLSNLAASHNLAYRAFLISGEVTSLVKPNVSGMQKVKLGGI
jgi:hypothetical protein